LYLFEHKYKGEEGGKSKSKSGRLYLVWDGLFMGVKRGEKETIEKSSQTQKGTWGAEVVKAAVISSNKKTGCAGLRPRRTWGGGKK